MSGTSATRAAYTGAQTERRAPCKPQTKVVTPDVPFSGASVVAQDYLPPAYSKREPIRPSHHRQAATAPFEGVTTKDVDFGPKHISARVPAKATPGNLRPNSGKFATATVKQQDFVAHPHSQRAPIKPQSGSIGHVLVDGSPTIADYRWVCTLPPQG